MARSWGMSPADAQAGDPGPLLIVDRSNGFEGRAVCILSVNLARQAQDSTIDRVLDDQDLANATAIKLVPRMRGVLAELVRWAAHMGRLGCRVLALRRGRGCTHALRP